MFLADVLWAARFANKGYNVSIMSELGNGGLVIYGQFPRQLAKADLSVPRDQKPNSDEAELAIEIEKYNFYRDQFLADAQRLAVQEGAPVAIDPLGLTMRFHEIGQMSQSMERHVLLGDFLAELKEVFAELRMSNPVVAYAMTLSRRSGPDIYQLVRYEGLIQDVIVDTSYKNWDEVLNSDVDVVEEPTNLPNDLYFSILPALQARDGAWYPRQGSLANDVPFAQMLAICFKKESVPRPRRV